MRKRVSHLIPIRAICFVLAVSMAATCLAIAPGTVTIPAGTDIQIRLTNKVASDASKPKDVINAVVIAPVMVNGLLAVPAGTRIRGRIDQAKRAVSADERALLQFDFNEIVASNGKTAKLKTRILDVDNARRKR